MKNVKLSFLSIFAFLFSLTITAQIKKPIAKPKLKPELVTKQLILGQDLEAVTVKLDEILSRNGYIFDKVTDENIYFFDITGTPTKQIRTFKRILDLQNDLHIILTANQDSKIYDISIYSFTNQNFKTEEVKLLSFLNFKNWLVKDQNLYETVFSLGQNILTTNKQYLSINAFIPDATEFYSENYPEINIDSINIDTPIEKVHLFMLQKLKKANLKLLCIKQNEIENDKSNVFLSNTINSFYTQGINLSIKSDKIQKKEIYITCPNPIVFNNIKKVFFDNNSWISQYEFRRNSGAIENYFKYKNLLACVNDASKSIRILITTTDNESAKKILYGKTLNLDTILEIINGFANNVIVESYMSDHYKLEWEGSGYLFRFWDGSSMSGIKFGNGINNKGWKFTVISQDNKLTEQLSKQLSGREDELGLITRNGKYDKGYFINFFDKNIFNNEQQKEESEAAQQRQIAAERRQQEEENRRIRQQEAQQAAAQAETERIEKARRTEANMKEFNGAMQNLLNTLTKKP